VTNLQIPSLQADVPRLAALLCRNMPQDDGKLETAFQAHQIQGLSVAVVRPKNANKLLTRDPEAVRISQYTVDVSC